MKALLIAAAALAFAAPAFAGTPVSLRMDTTDADGRVTLGDLFDGVSGAAANLVVAPRMGPSAVLDAGQVQVFARRAGFDWDNSQGIRRIIVREGADNGGGAPAGAPRGADAVIGLAAKRPLREGAAVSTRDVTAPQVIKTGDLITVTYSDGGISLSLQGKAMAAAATGDVIAVQNTLSK